MTTLEQVRRLPGLESYLERVEARLEAAVARHPGVVAEVGAEALAAGKTAEDMQFKATS